MANVDGPPLEDPNYTPEHPPVDGRIPPVVAKWGKASQLRWFRRFNHQLSEYLTAQELASFWCSSEEHRGLCCFSCLDEKWEGYYDSEPHCCCYGIREALASEGEQ